ncbi:MAG TPA: TIGR01906 family membrane protein [Candidatus Binatia bacterium]|nr:TIGR01906 family membrane protein [Candidatus Binatia bacterium]
MTEMVSKSEERAAGSTVMSRRVVDMVRWLVVAAMPFFLGFSAVGLFVNSFELYIAYEYAKPNFPRDLGQVSEVTRQQLGLTPLSQDEREQLALVAVDYIQRPDPAEEVIHLLEDQRLPGSERPLYNASEISHMLDLKHVTDGVARLNWLAAFVVLGGLALLLLQPGTRSIGYLALFQGGMATMVLLLLIGLFIVLGWSIFFVQFHELLFPPGTWTFAYSDSLIRLFPEKFWFDFGVLQSLLAFLLGAIVTLIGWLLWRRRG